MIRRQKSAGITLMELMITVAIIGILARIALPAYNGYRIRSNRADAQQTLLRAAQGLERYAVTNGNSGYSSASLTGLAVVSTVSQSPQSGTAIYTMTLSANQSTYTVTATPVSTGVNANDGTLSINQAGVKTWTNHTDWTH